MVINSELKEIIAHMDFQLNIISNNDSLFYLRTFVTDGGHLVPNKYLVNISYFIHAQDG